MKLKWISFQGKDKPIEPTKTYYVLMKWEVSQMQS